MSELGMQGQELMLEASWLCLDFANTAEWHASEHPEEKLNTYLDLIAWAQSVNLLSERAAGILREEAAAHPDAAGEALRYAIALREAIWAVFAALADGETPRQSDLEIVNEAMAQGLSHLRVVPAMEDGSFRWEWDVRRDSLYQVLWPVARSAGELLTSEDLDRVGKCADEDGCGWLFFDSSKNRSRRWCGAGCANRAKARRFYARQKEARAGE